MFIKDNLGIERKYELEVRPASAGELLLITQADFARRYKKDDVLPAKTDYTGSVYVEIGGETIYLDETEYAVLIPQDVVRIDGIEYREINEMLTEKSWVYTVKKGDGYGIGVKMRVMKDLSSAYGYVSVQHEETKKVFSIPPHELCHILLYDDEKNPHVAEQINERVLTRFTDLHKKILASSETLEQCLRLILFDLQNKK